VIVIGKIVRHFPYFAIRISIVIFEKKKSGDGLLMIVVEAPVLEKSVDEKRGWLHSHWLS